MGALRRRIHIVYTPREVRAALEDDYHHFRVRLQHDGERVLAIQGDALRHPYSLCPGALGELHQLCGIPLANNLTMIARRLDRLQQCTHLFDLSCLAITTAADQRPHKYYDIQVDDPVPHQPRRAQLQLDGATVLDWLLDENQVISGAYFHGIDIRSGFRRHIEHAGLPAQAIEWAHVLRRGIFISKGRYLPWTENTAAQAGGCYTLQPQRLARAEMIPDSRRDFSDRGNTLIATDQDWLATTD